MATPEQQAILDKMTPQDFEALYPHLKQKQGILPQVMSGLQRFAVGAGKGFLGVKPTDDGMTEKINTIRATEAIKQQFKERDPSEIAKRTALEKFSASEGQSKDEDLWKDIPEEDRKFYRVKKTYQNIDGVPVVIDQEVEETTAGKRAMVQREKDSKLEESKQIRSQGVKDSANDALNTIAKVKAGTDYFGAYSYIPKVAGTPRKDWEQNLNKLLSGMVIDVMVKMKEASKTGATGFGQLSEKELAVLQQASTALKESSSKEQAIEILDTMETQLKKVASTGQKIPINNEINKITMQAPDGTQYSVDENEVVEAEQNGWTRI